MRPQKTRIRAIIELREGATRREVAKRTVVESDTITNWIKAYNRGGAQDEPGRPPQREWDPTIFEALAREIDKGERYWSVPCRVAWIRERYGKAILQSTLWYHARHLDYSYKSARPHPAKGDPAQHQAFKKGALPPPSRR